MKQITLSDGVVPLITVPYAEIENLNQLPETFVLGDNMGGFDDDVNNDILHKINDFAKSQDRRYNIITDQRYTKKIKDHYPNLNFVFSLEVFLAYSSLLELHDYKQHPERNVDTFLCSFNASDHVSRRLLSSSLHRRGWWNNETCTKNFVIDEDSISAHVMEHCGDQERRYIKFFLGPDSGDFFRYRTDGNSINDRFRHSKNIYNLEQHLVTSWLHVVSESIATSHWPIVTEKFVYSVVTRQFFIGWGPPGWHRYLRDQLGFRLYDKVFDYGFDEIANPIHRLCALLDSISGFACLDKLSWHDLWLMEHDAIEYNLDHYHSKNYIDCYERFSPD